MIIAITGGIGSGKSFVCEQLKKQGIAVYDCDAAAKRLMATDQQLQDAINRAVGQEVFPQGVLDKAVLTQFLLQSEANNITVNDIIHPAVAEDFRQSGMQWVESAILFESGFDRMIHPDFVIVVAAADKVRVERICRRDGIDVAKAMQWINRQMPQDEKVAKADFVITNDGCRDLRVQIEACLKKIENINSRTE